MNVEKNDLNMLTAVAIKYVRNIHVENWKTSVEFGIWKLLIWIVKMEVRPRLRS